MNFKIVAIVASALVMLLACGVTEWLLETKIDSIGDLDFSRMKTALRLDDPQGLLVDSLREEAMAVRTLVHGLLVLMACLNFNILLIGVYYIFNSKKCATNGDGARGHSRSR